MLKRVSCLALLAVVAPTFAADPVPGPDREMIPRTALKKTRIVMPADHTSQLIMKLHDSSRGTVLEGDFRLQSAFGADLSEVDAIQDELGLQFERLFKTPVDQLRDIEKRALAFSGKQQPCLECFFVVKGDDTVLQVAADRLIEAGVIETGWFSSTETVPAFIPTPSPNPSPAPLPDPDPNPLGGDEEGGNQACCQMDGQVCTDETPANCLALGGYSAGPGSSCLNIPYPCGQACCLPNGDCDDRPVFQCENMFSGGQSQGAGSDCNGYATCFEGACCLPFDNMVQCIDSTTGLPGSLTMEVCEDDLGGVYQGHRTLCADLPPCPDLGNCCGSTICDDDCCPLLEGTCLTFGGTWEGLGTNCNDDNACADPDCGVLSVGSCFEVNIAFCNDEDCCTLVCDLDPMCCDIDNYFWDQFCVDIAHSYCLPGIDTGPTPGADRCLSPLAGSCFSAVPSTVAGGCADTTCCNIVTAIDPFCALIWDQLCVNTAVANCVSVADADPTPDLSVYQLYLGIFGWTPSAASVVGVPFQSLGFNGRGLGLFDETGTSDTAGLHGLGKLLQDTYGVGTELQAKGASVKIAVLDDSYRPNHEALVGRVVYESDITGVTQTMFPELSVPDHGTAVLGMLAAEENGSGIRGIAPNAEVSFFPTLSIEEGFREFTAMTNAMTYLDIGDVMLQPYNHVEGINLWPNNSLAPGSPDAPEIHALMIQVATDLGITVVLPAGESCSNLDDATDNGNVGAIVVSAIHAGIPAFRWDSANWDGVGGEALAQSNQVTVSGWGDFVVTAGYGDLFIGGGDMDRSYTRGFGGTSAAATMVAGAVADLQGLAKQFWGIPISPYKIQSAVNISGFGQPTEGRLAGGDLTLINGICVPDFNGAVEIHDIVGMLNAAAAGAAVLSAEGISFDNSPLIEKIWTLSGTYKFGNLFSVKDNDQGYYVIESRHKAIHETPDNQPNFASSVAGYLATGEICDVMIQARNPAPNASQATILVDMSYPGQNVLAFLEVFDVNKQKWVLAGFGTFLDSIGGVPGQSPDQALAATIANVGDFTHPDTRDILFRVWSLGIGGGQGGNGGINNSSTYFMRIDFVDFDVESQLGTGPGILF